MKALSLLLLFLVTACSASNAEQLSGVYRNKLSNFNEVKLVILENGYASITGGVTRLFCPWTFDETSKVFTYDCTRLFTIDNPGPVEPANKYHIYFKYSEEKSAFYKLETKNDEENLWLKSEHTLYLVDKIISESTLTNFTEFDKLMQEAEKEAEEEAKEKAFNQQRDKIIEAIRENPKVVLSKEFYTEEFSPSDAALNSVLLDKTTAFPEEILVQLLINLPANSWSRHIIFDRSELSANTIEKFYDKADEWGQLSQTDILSNIQKHPNTPQKIKDELTLKMK